MSTIIDDTKCHECTRDRVFVGKKIPNFHIKTVMPDNEIKTLELHDYFGESKGVIFFYPLDFTFVCPSEIIAINNRINEFNDRDTKVLLASVDSPYCHLAWKRTSYEKGGVGDIAIPMVADLTKEMSKTFGVLSNEGISLRGTFVVDENLVLRHMLINDAPIGRSIEEMMRVIDALIHFQEYGEVCPAGWHKGKEGMTPTTSGVSSYLTSHADTL
ncbi:Peroxiredoxin [Rickettsiales endosymbiont of Paramecium tredecaurelia]|uniref:peroxiredoxin n=1 Tax=Candidatus Sarmatiella mevalonica TaxID=2770581 RepID=UPI0019225D1F|nr:peroxiredoxin [Candidatus Sarmatiella mevalonica]MBL3284333.1 Peroxiredoxin [Candidatus Sarmatiella mevalonica]